MRRSVFDLNRAYPPERPLHRFGNMHAQSRTSGLSTSPSTTQHALRHSATCDPCAGRSLPLRPRRHLSPPSPPPQTHRTTSAFDVACHSVSEALPVSGIGSSLNGPEVDGSAAPRARLVAVVPSETVAPLGVPWREVMQQMARRLSWVDPGFQMQVGRSNPPL